MFTRNENWARGSGVLAVLGAAAAMLMVTTAAFADDSVSMAPPIDTGTASSAPNADSPMSDSVFNWTEVPVNEKTPITRAVFDKGGYQLYDTVGETIVVPFTNNNLYVMKFAVSPDGTTFFINTGTDPVLYLPTDGYLENATVPGARWYPFTNDFHPSEPVYLGIAPGYDDYLDMGWYPDMYCWGGYWGYDPFWDGGLFVATDGFLFLIDGENFLGWGGYFNYVQWHHAPYHTGWWGNHNWRGDHFGGGGRRFGGTTQGYHIGGSGAFGSSGGAFARSRSFRGSTEGYLGSDPGRTANRSLADRGGSFGGATRRFRGADPGAFNYARSGGGSGDAWAGRSWDGGGGSRPSFNQSRSFDQSRSFNESRSFAPSQSFGSRAWSGGGGSIGRSGGGGWSGGGGRDSGGRSSGGRRR